MTRPLLVALGVSALSSWVAAQAPLVVGPAGVAPYQQLDEALAVANPGDLISVLPGTYDPFTCTIPARILAQPGTVTITVVSTSIPITTLAPTGGELHVYGVDFVNPFSFGVPQGQDIVVSGRVTLDRCDVDLYRGTMAANNANLHLQSCNMDAESWPFVLGWSTLRAIDSTVTAVDTNIELSPSISSNTSGTVALTNSRLFASGCTITGIIALPYFQPAVALDPASQAWISDSTIQAHQCVFRGPWGNPAGLVALSRCQVISAVAGTDCAGETNIDQLGVTRTSPLVVGQPFTATFRTAPSSVVFTLAAPILATIDVPGLLAQPSWLDFATYLVADATVTDGLGEATYGFVVPANPALEGVPIWFEGVEFGDFPLRVSAPIGGVISQ